MKLVWLVGILLVCVPDLSATEAIEQFKSCSGLDCFRKNRENLNLLINNRTVPTQDQLCALGDYSASHEEIFERVKQFCHNHFIDGNTYTPDLINNDVILKNAFENVGSFKWAKTIGRQVLLNDRYYPDIINLYLDQDPCGRFFHQNCRKAERKHLVNDSEAFQRFVKQLVVAAPAWSQSTDAFATACVQRIRTNYEKYLIASPYSFIESDALAFCKSIAPIVALDMVYKANMTGADQTQLNLLMTNIGQSYSNWFKSMGSVNFEVLETILRATSVKPTQPWQISIHANIEVKPSGEILYSPLFLTFLRTKGGAENLWFVSAHEIAHRFTLKGTQLDDKFMDYHVGYQTVRSCSLQLYKLSLSHMGDTSIRAEVLADYLATGALGAAMTEFDNSDDAKQFMFNATNAMCAIFTATSTEWEKFKNGDDIVKKYYHATTWTRINAIFANNQVRKAIGCPLFTGEEQECHNW